jgi:hypothetical protein
MTYAEKLQDPRWQKKRLEILQQGSWTCAGCFSTTNMLHVHHKVYLPDREPWDYPDDHLEVLCKDCHAKRSKESKLIDTALLHGLKVNIADSFVMGCAVQIFQKKELHNLIFIIWQLGVEDSLKALNGLFTAQCESQLEKSTQDGNI